MKHCHCTQHLWPSLNFSVSESMCMRCYLRFYFCPHKDMIEITPDLFCSSTLTCQVWPMNVCCCFTDVSLACLPIKNGQFCTYWCKCHFSGCAETLHSWKSLLSVMTKSTNNPTTQCLCPLVTTTGRCWLHLMKFTPGQSKRSCLKPNAPHPSTEK